MEEDKGGKNHMQRDWDCSFSSLVTEALAVSWAAFLEWIQAWSHLQDSGQTRLFSPAVCPASHRVLPSAPPFLTWILQAVQEDLSQHWSNSPQGTLQSADVGGNNGQLFPNETVCISQAGYSALGSLGYDRKAVLASVSWLLMLSFSLVLGLSQASTATISSLPSQA